MAILINLFSNTYEQHYPIHEIVSRELELIEDEALIFYLPQCMQCLRTDSKGRMFRLLVRFAKKSRKFTHRILWMAQVERVLDTNSKRKVALPYPTDELPSIAGKLYDIIENQMSLDELAIYQDETKFFEQITDISGRLKAKEHSKAEKKTIIQKYLEKYNAELVHRDPSSPVLYLPTSPHCQVKSIITDTGTPMQSAERCPIMISFVVTYYEGINKKPKIDLKRFRSSIFEDIRRERSLSIEESKRKMREAHGNNEADMSLSNIQITMTPKVEEEKKMENDSTILKPNDYTKLIVSKDPVRAQSNVPIVMSPITKMKQRELKRIQTLITNPIIAKKKGPKLEFEGERIVSCIFKVFPKKKLNIIGKG